MVPRIENPPTVDAGGPYIVNEGSTIELVAQGDDPDGDPISYAWDLDNDGTFETVGQSVGFSAADINGPSNQAVVAAALPLKATEVQR